MSEGKRIVVIGGSSVPFSLRSDLVEREFPDYVAVDFGLYASLGTKMMLDLALPDIREGDIVVLSPEQNHQTLSLFFNGREAWQAMDGAFSLLSRIQKDDLKCMIGNLPSFASSKFSYFASGTKLDPEGVYNRKSFNEYGDISYADRKQNTMAGGYDRATLPDFSKEAIDAEFIDYLNEFCRSVQGKGASIYYRFCPINRLSLQGTDENAVDAYYDFLSERLDFPILGNPHDCVMDGEWFYDTNFHLNESGAIVHTRNFIRDLKVALKDTSPTHVVLPAKPSMPEWEKPIEEELSDLSCFTYEKTEQGVVITSLTEEGRARESLKIPTSWQGERIVAVEAGVLRNNTRLKEVVIRSNIAVLYDGTFDGCTSLSRIVLLNDDPSSVQVGSDLLRGTRAKLYVPAEARNSYRTYYLWSNYADRILAEEGGEV